MGKTPLYASEQAIWLAVQLSPFSCDVGFSCDMPPKKRCIMEGEIECVQKRRAFKALGGAW